MEPERVKVPFVSKNNLYIFYQLSNVLQLMKHEVGGTIHQA